MSGVLIVDDNAYTRHAVRTSLQLRTKLEICGEASDGLDAIEKASQLNPDLILLDLSMPRISAETASVLKRRMPHIRIILFSLYDEAMARSVASALEVDLVLPKTEGLARLADRAQALLGRRK